jgi:IS30 family transposase
VLIHVVAMTTSLMTGNATTPGCLAAFSGMKDEGRRTSAGSKNSYIATLVERQTRYVTLAKVANKDTQTVVSALIKQAKTIPNELYKSLTWDRGKELADHRRLTLATNIDVYFCDPQSPWQRGSNENTNGLLRQYLPKGTDLSVYSQAQLNKVARQLNERPRKTLGFATPAERFNACVASTT